MDTAISVSSSCLFLPAGSTYVGIDKGEELFKESPFRHGFVHANILEYEAKAEADISITHTVPMHLSDRVNYYSSERTGKENEELLEALIEEGIAAMPKKNEDTERNRKRLQQHGFTLDEIEQQLQRELRINDFMDDSEVKDVAFAPAMMFTSGIVYRNAT